MRQSPMKKTDISIIIVSYNTRELLDRCLNSVYKGLTDSDLNFEVIVVDNASTDGSVEMLTQKYLQVKLIKNTTNVGFGRANNQGAEMARGKQLLFLNSDIIVLDRAIVKLSEYGKTWPQAVIGGKLFNPDRSPQTSCGPAYSLPNIFVALFLKGDYLNLTRYSPQQIKQVDWVMGACMLMSKEMFLRVGKFDEGIFMYMEEIDFAHRAQKLGAKIYFYPDAHFIHVGAASSHGRANPILNVFRGLIYYYNKHGSSAQKLLLRILLLLKAVSAIILFSLMGKKYDRDIYIKALVLVI
ncbi:TPA: glycosyl transferase family 2 [Patescibacteria group bacterium]|nr:glycosyl transferase family 2 [Patescibacteria group bacterium]